MKDTMIQSFEAGNSGAYGDLLSQQQDVRAVRIGLLTCGYFEYWHMYPGLREEVQQDLEAIVAHIEERIGATVRSGLVDTLDAAEAAGRRFAAERVDALIVVEGTYLPDFISLHAIDFVKNVPLLLVSMQMADDVNIHSNYQHSLRNSGIIGVAQLSGTLRKMKRKFRTVVGAIGEERAYERIASFAAAVRGVSSLREANIGVIGHVFRGMYDLELSKTFLKSAFDVNIIYIQSAHLMDEWEGVSQEAAESVKNQLMARFRTRGVTENDILRACRLAVAMQRLVERFHLDALCFLDQHYVQRQTRTSARIGASLLMENTPVSVACEGDLGGLVMMMLMRAISGAAPLMGEWGEFDTTTNSCFIIGHGIASPELAVSDGAVTLTRTPEDWGINGAGLNYEFLLKPGLATIGHLLEKQDGYRMLIAPVESIPFQTLQYDELHAMLQVKTPVREYLERIFDAGVAHHAIVCPGDISVALGFAADLLEIETLVAR